ncbi:MAG: RNA-directed DNA polymerase [Planctomycetia bacterium]|nr:RNA-directed DNA polymerase [Planctomycetia bacterium]
MGLFQWLRGLFGFGDAAPESSAQPHSPSSSRASDSNRATPAARPPRKRRRPARLKPLRFKPPRKVGGRTTLPKDRGYRFARPSVTGGWLDLSQGGDASRLERYSLPVFKIPEQLAKWLEIPLGQLGWLVHRFDDEHRAADEKSAHYFYRWIDKRAGGKRLIEAPKVKLKGVQWKILDGILRKVPAHPAAHGFVTGRSISTNAVPHVGQRVVLQLDLENFYPSVSLNRVVAIFRSLGYCREAAIWLGRLTTTTLPASMTATFGRGPEIHPYRGRRLPQGAPTSPALANLSAFVLDLRLSGLARTFGANYTRYADDLTFSGDAVFLKSLAVFIPLVKQIVRDERFLINRRKWRVLRNNQRQTVAGVVVNTRTNVARKDYDRLKATLTNCVRRGASTQNHDRHERYASHLLGRIAHVAHLNPARGEKLRVLYDQIDWNK